MKKIIVLSLIAASLLLPVPASASNCKKWYDFSADQMANVKPEFLKQHNKRYSLEVKSTEVKNQCQYGGCWVYGTVSNLETKILHEQGVTVDLSEQYLIMRSLQERSLGALETPGQQITEGGLYEGALALIRIHGIVPAGVWEPKIPFESQPHKGRLLNFLNNRIAKFHLDVAKNPANKTKEMDKAGKDILDILTAYAGEPPSAFTYKGKKYASPKAYADSIIRWPEKPPTRLTLEKEALPEELEKVKPKSESNTRLGLAVKAEDATVSYAKMEKAIVKALREGKTVSITTDMVNEFISGKTGIISIAAFRTPKGFKPVPRSYRDAFKIASSSHLMEIVGVDLNKSGRVIKYKIKNSWNDTVGDKGYYHMYPDYFKNYVNNVVVP